ncbi:MAG TPA: SRPBCC domain-containing protein [Aliidongia sp.]|uniref:SRPBCC family protein n=1 Tax=Aliidongia sp. TaxID=1914230 RepID=UPI002DDCAB38|nr:SRPBCC domain-containing protein [Aliidongia sp.]HEV2675875.1 SRPBCC domain-containing protein [Aliidongia sp.]
MSLKTQTVADTGTVIDREAHTIVLTRIVAASREQVFEAWTRAEHVACWWDPAGRPLAECEIDLRPGGTFRFLNHPSSGAPPFAGVYREIAAPGRLVFEAMGAIGRVILIDLGGKTHLTLRIECASGDHLEQYLKMGIDAGTARTLDNLVEYIGTEPG